MAAGGENNPIKYSDLVSPDNSIEQLIVQLTQLRTTYKNALKEIRQEAVQLTQQLQSVSGATQQGQRTTRTAVTETSRLTRAQENLEQSYDETSRQLASLRQLTNEQNTINRLTARLNNSLEGSYDRLSAQYSLNRIRLNQMTQATRDNTDAGRELTEQTRRIREEMDQLQRSTGNFSLNVGNYPELNEYNQQIGNAIGLNGEFGSSLMQMIQNGDGAGTVLQNMGTRALAFGRTLLTLLSNPVFIAIAGIAAAGMAFKWWYNYNVGLIEATKLTKQFTGESGNDLKALRNEIQATGDMYGKDFKEVLIASNALAKQFGISQQEAITLIQDGFIAGADANGEFLESVKEYPAYFKEAGLSASQFIAITTQAGKSGIYSDKAVDTIKEGNLRIREMTKSTAMALEGIGLNYKELQTNLQNGSMTTFDVIQKVSEKLNELPENSAVVGTAIADIFGGPGEDAGLAYLKTLKDIDLDLSNLVDQSGELGKSQRDLLKSNAELANTTSALFDQTGGTFEMLINKGKILANDVLISIVRGLINIVNWGIKVYNSNILIRASVQNIATAFTILWSVAKNTLGWIADQAKAVGDALVSLATMDFSGLAKAMIDINKNNKQRAKNVLKDTANAIASGVQDLNKKVKPIEIPVLTVGDITQPKGGSTGKAAIADYTKPDKKDKDKETDINAVYRKNLELKRKYEDAFLSLETNSFEKRRKEILFNYQRQSEDLQFQLKTEKDLTETGKAAIVGMILNLSKQQTQELTKLENERQISLLEQQKSDIQLRLDAVKKGTDAEYQLQVDLMEKERELALKQNSSKPDSEQQSADSINLKFDTDKTALDDSFKQMQLTRFDILQQMEQSEFDLLYNSEERKTKFKLEAEKKRWQKILEINKTMGNKLSDAEVQTIQNTIAKIDQEIGDTGKGNQDIYDLFGLNLDDEAKEGISESVSFALGQIASILDAKVQAAEQAVTAADKEVDSSQKLLDAELQARANGYANNVLFAQKELDQAKKNQEKANKEKEKAVKQQQLLDTITQTSSLITASANIWSSLSAIPVVGTALALAAIGLMWGSFAASKIKARSVTKGAGTESFGGGGFIETVTGGSHQSGNDVDFGTKPDGTRRRVEGGETVAVFNKRNSRKYKRVLPDLVKSLNNGSFGDKYLNAYDGAKNISINASSESFEVGQIRDDVREMKDRKRYVVDGNGNTVEFYKNLKRTIKR